MNRLKPGDRIVCHIKDLRIVSPYAEHNESQIFEILSLDNTGYFVYVPDYIALKGTTRLTQYNIKALGINVKFTGCFVVYVPDSAVAKVHSILDGETCKKCTQFFHQACPNQEDGSFLCFLCRSYPYR